MWLLTPTTNGTAARSAASTATSSARDWPMSKRAGAGILGAGQRLHRQMQHDFFALRVGLTRERDRMRAERQHSHGHGARQTHGALAFGQAIADVVDDQSDFRQRVGNGGSGEPGRHEKHDVGDDGLDPTHHGAAVCAIES